jgi:3-hydroxybutyryl-CoA dehydrogenase
VSVSVIGVVGAGFMGSGIAQSVATAGKHALVYEPERAALERSRETIERSLGRAISLDRMRREQAKSVIGRIGYTTTLAALGEADAVIEAVPESSELKCEVFARLDAELPTALFLASNTSSIPVAELAASTTRPERVLGLHFFSPVTVMTLVEIVTALQTSEAAVAAAERLVVDIGKQFIRTKDRSGFVVNMLLIPYLIAAIRMYEDGFASRADIDTGMKLGCGHPMGPLTLCDLIGLDVVCAICDALYEEFKRPEYAPPPLLRRMVVAGHHGRKTGRGFYDYGRSRTLTAVAA